jgi:hypothetical protein
MKSTGKSEARALKALDLRLAGASYRQIGVTLKVSHVQAYRDVTGMLHQYASEPAEKVREVELGRLDRLLLAHWEKATKGDGEATRLVLSIMDRRAKLLGLDAPQRIDISGWIREMAEREGLDPAQAVKDADAIVKAAGV